VGGVAFLPQGVTQSVGGCGTAWLGMTRQIKPSISCVKYWEVIADNLSKAGWSLGCISAVDSRARTIFAVDGYRDGQRFIVRADEKLTAFVELESATRLYRRNRAICGLMFSQFPPKNSLDTVGAGAAKSARAKLFRRLPKSST